jgi:hypothetical protein
MLHIEATPVAMRFDPEGTVEAIATGEALVDLGGTLTWYLNGQQLPETSERIVVPHSQMVVGDNEVKATVSIPGIDFGDKPLESKCSVSLVEDGEQGPQGEAYVVVIESTNGDVFKPGEMMTTMLRPKIFLNGEDVTSSIPDSWFRWRRKSFYEPNDDLTWNSNHTAGYRSIEVTANDISARATFFCDVVSP